MTRNFPAHGYGAAAAAFAAFSCALLAFAAPAAAQLPDWLHIPFLTPQKPAEQAQPPAEAPKAAKPRPKKEARPATPREAKKEPAGPPPEPPPPPYEPQVLRLAEILGALAYLEDLCGSKENWRARMQTFLEAEARTPDRKERLAGAFNRAFHDYEASYRSCGGNAEAVIARFLREGGRIARDVAARYSET
ncbi:TIGR02301 family protein [Methylocella sp.]|uniref:TIGR02301 family protein n=1 Tax=Methylocella sp. TaxID=1978226 RepID=UPI0037837DF5